jgi:hypothetical protein
MADSESVLAPFERWNLTLWFGFGAIGIVYASLFGMEVFIGTYPAGREFLGPVMNGLAFTALLGLYPVLADRRPWLARAGGVCAVLAAVGSLVALGVTAGIFSEGTTWVAANVFLFIILGMALAFLAFGVASLRSAVYSRVVGLLLLVPAVIMGLNVGIVVAGYASPEGRLLVNGLWTVTYLAIEVTLRTEGGAIDRSDPTPDATAR